MKDALAVGIGGFFGCIMRYLVGILAARFFDEPTFPFATDANGFIRFYERDAERFNKCEGETATFLSRCFLSAFVVPE